MLPKSTDFPQKAQSVTGLGFFNMLMESLSWKQPLSFFFFFEDFFLSFTNGNFCYTIWVSKMEMTIS